MSLSNPSWSKRPPTAAAILNAKMWDVKEADGEEFVTGKLVKIKAKVQEYNGNLQIIVNRMRLANEGDPVTVDDFVETVPVSIARMLKEFDDTVAAFKNEDLKKLTAALIDDKRAMLNYFPAAKRMHHAIKGGLLYHSWSILLSMRICCSPGS